MFTMTTYPRNPVTDPYTATATLGRAAQELLELYAKYDTALVTPSWHRVQLSVKEAWSGVDQYYGYLVLEEPEDSSDPDFMRLLRLSRVMELLTNWCDGFAEHMPKLFPPEGGYQLVIPENRESINRAVIACLGAQWLLGRDIDWVGQNNPELPSALGMAVREELENGIKAEETLSALLA